MSTPANRKKPWLRSRIGVRIVIWGTLCLVLSFVSFRNFWVSLPHILSPDWVFGENHASSWGVLALCLVFLWVKRQRIYTAIIHNKKFTSYDIRTALGLYILNIETLLGVVLVAVAVLLATFVSSANDYAVFQVLLAWLGMFILIFGKEAVVIPAILLALYGFVLFSPLIISRFAEEQYALTALIPLRAFLSLLGFPFQSNGQILHLVSADGEAITVQVSIACAGSTTMAVFIALFILMMLDIPLPPRKATWLFFAGIAGTWFQSFIRLAILMLVAYYLGSKAMWIAHSWSIYILFPIWYLLFVYIYFRQVGRIRKSKTVSVSDKHG